MDKLTTAYVRECLARESYKDTLDPLTLDEIRERQIEVNMNGWYVRILELSSDETVAYYTHMVNMAGKGGVYDHNRTLACLVRRINKVCLASEAVVFLAASEVKRDR